MKGVLCFLLYLLSIQSPSRSGPFQAATAKVAALRRTIVNKPDQTTSRGKVFFWGSPLQIFWVGDSIELEAKSGRSPLSQTGAGGLVGPGGGGALEGWKGSGAERERHICCTAGRSV